MTATAESLSVLFSAAFSQSSNAMVLLDVRRRLVDANAAYVRLLGYRRELIIGRPIYRFVAGGPLASPAQWKAALVSGQFTGQAELLCAAGDRVAVQWAATTELVTGRYLALFVALNTSRRAVHLRRTVSPSNETAALSAREREVLRLVALGSTCPEVADELRIAHDTVRTHVRNAMVKLGARSGAHLVAKALGDGLALE